MDKHQREALLVRLAGQLRANDSWCGETHIQKAAFFLQEMTGVPLQYDFILYKHGPFSFDLRDEIRELVAYQLLDLQAQEPPYGPRLAPNDRGEALATSHSQVASEFARNIEHVAETLGDQGAAELEKLGTALWYVVHGNGATLEAKAAKIHDRKPHISVEKAEEALNQIEELRQTWASQA